MLQDFHPLRRHALCFDAVADSCMYGRFPDPDPHRSRSELQVGELHMPSATLGEPLLLRANPPPPGPTRVKAKIFQKVVCTRLIFSAMQVDESLALICGRQETCLAWGKLQTCTFQPLFQLLISSQSFPANCDGILANKVNRNVINPGVKAAEGNASVGPGLASGSER